MLLLGVSAAILLGADRASAAYSAVLNGTTLELTGDGNGQRLVLRLAVSTTMLEVDVRGDGTADFTFDRALFDSIVVSAGAGNDVVSIDQSNGPLTGESVQISGGPGNDTLIGGSGADVILGDDGNDLVDANQGNDLILLGAGDDVTVWEPGDGSDTIEGQDDDDRIEFACSAASENLALSANGSRVLFFRDIGAITLDIDGVEQLDLEARGGQDVLTMNDLAGTDLVRVNADLEAVADGEAGDGQADSVVLHGSGSAEVVSIGVRKGVVEVEGLSAAVRVAHGEPALDTVRYVVLGADEVHLLGTKRPDVISIAPSPVVGALRASADTFPVAVDVSGGGLLAVFGLRGADQIVAATSGILALGIDLELDGGTGKDVITGGDGDDVLFGGSGKDLVSGGRGSDLLFLQGGSDTAIWQPGDGNDTIEGETGRDTLDFRGSGAGENIDVSANGGRALLFRDVGAITMDLNDVEMISVSALLGADNIVVNDLAGTDVKRVIVDLEAALGTGGGDAQIDSVVVNGTSGADKMRIKAGTSGVSVARTGGAVRVEHAEVTDNLVLNGLAGEDDIKAAASVASAITVTINPD